MQEKKPDCQSCKNLNCLIKKSIGSEAMTPFIKGKASISFKKGQGFIFEGAPVHGLYFVHSGKVKVSKSGINGREQIVRLVGDGEIIGHRGFGADSFYQINAETLADTVLCNFSTSSLEQMLRTVPMLTYDFMIFYAEELNRSEAKVKKFAQMTVREKVIDALLYVNRKFGQSETLLTVQLSRREIANFAGTTEEQVIRVISALKKESLLCSSGKQIGIVDVEKLKKEIAAHNYFLDS
ncbi:MAG: Crp/Fnr family transcriptional regulator [Bacteroidota bacterium]